MATKKQKREAGLAKRAALEEELKETGLRAQTASRERLEQQVQKRANEITEMIAEKEQLLRTSLMDRASWYGRRVAQYENFGHEISRHTEQSCWIKMQFELEGSPHLKACVDAYKVAYDKTKNN